MINLRSLSNLFRAARKLAAACACATAITAAAAGQTNTFPSSGNAGVGTTSPSDAVHIVKDNGGLTLDTATSGTIVPVFRFSTTGTPRASIQYRPDLPGLAFQTGGIAYPAQNRMVLTDSGNLGIGVTSPNARFVIGSGLFGLGTNNLATWSHATSVIESLDSSIFFGLDTDIGLNSNAYHYNGWKYKTADLAANIHLYKGDMYFRTAAAGTTDAPLTWANSMFISNAGNVGIGTTAPTFPLEVSKSQAAPTFFQVTNSNSSTGNAAGVRMFTSGNNALTLSATGNAGVGGYAAITQEANLPLLFQTNVTERMRITGGGNVGIGITAPSYKLDVNGEINATGLRINGTPISTGGSQWTGSSSIYYNGGNVGIGTTSPSTKLELAPNSAIKLGNAYFSSGGDYVHLSNNEWYNGASWTASAAGALIQISGQEVNFYRHDAAGAHTQSMAIKSSGNVGIGTTSPVYSLDVNGGVNGFRAKAATTSSSDAIATFENSSGIQAIVRGNGYIGVGTTAPGVKLDVHGYIAAGSLNGFVFTDDLNTGLTSSAPDKLNLVTGGTTRLHVDNAGNIGVGNTSPTEKLHVTGNGKFTGNLSVDGTVNAKYQDVAEWVPSSEQLAAGTVVVLDQTKSNQVVSSNTGYDTRVAGVISAQPGITLGESGEGKVLVATTGRVRVKVDASRGPIQIGDLLVTSDVAGVAMKSEPVEFAGRKMHMPGTIIGKALEPMAKGSGEILVLLSLQ